MEVKLTNAYLGFWLVGFGISSVPTGTASLGFVYLEEQKEKIVRTNQKKKLYQHGIFKNLHFLWFDFCVVLQLIRLHIYIIGISSLLLDNINTDLYSFAALFLFFRPFLSHHLPHFECIWSQNILYSLRRLSRNSEHFFSSPTGQLKQCKVNKR